MKFFAHLLLALAQACRVALHVAGVAEGGGVGREVGVLEQRLGLQVSRLKLLEVLPIQAVILCPGIRHFHTTFSDGGLLMTAMMDKKQISIYCKSQFCICAKNSNSISPHLHLLISIKYVES